MTTTTTRVADLQLGDRILPPPREVALWMRKALVQKGLTEDALWLTVLALHSAAPDSRGPWMAITAVYGRDWLQGKPAYPWTFKARPETLWITREERPAVVRGEGGPWSRRLWSRWP